MGLKIIKESDVDYIERLSGLKSQLLEKEVMIWANLTQNKARYEEFVKRFKVVKSKTNDSEESTPQASAEMLKDSIKSQRANLVTIQGQAEIDKLQGLFGS